MKELRNHHGGNQGLTVIALGFTMGLESDRTIVILLSLLFGAVIGEGIDLDEKLNRVGAHLEVRFKKEGKESNIAERICDSIANILLSEHLR